MQSPTAIQKLGDDYNRHPVGTGPFVLKSWTAGDRLVLERNPDYWNAGHPYLDRVVMRPLPDSQARFASLLSGESDLVWADGYETDSIQKAKNYPDLTVYSHNGAGAAVFAFNTKVAPFDDVRVRRALVMALDRAKISQATTNGLARSATNPYGDASWIKCKDDGALPYDPNKAKELIKEYGKPVEFKMLVTATPRGRTFGQIFQETWKEIGAKVELEQVDQTSIPTRAFARQFQLTPWRIVDFVDPNVQMYANFHTGSPLNLANYSNPELDKLLEHQRVTVDRQARIEDFCAISRHINQQAIWFWLFQNTYFAIAKQKLKGLPTLHLGIIDVSNTWLE
jgi:4-phytase/acid phosphatase/peptide/nickel transport system substrate-binding protein